jgi:hypothetical protein
MKNYEKEQLDKMKGKMPYRNIGYLGFLGFLGFTYYIAYIPACLMSFALFGLFGGFFLNKLAYQKHDERYKENSSKARFVALAIALTVIFVIAICAALGFVKSETVLLICAFGLVAVSMFYAFSFWYYETR